MNSEAESIELGRLCSCIPSHLLLRFLRQQAAATYSPYQFPTPQLWMHFCLSEIRSRDWPSGATVKSETARTLKGMYPFPKMMAEIIPRHATQLRIASWHGSARNGLRRRTATGRAWLCAHRLR